MDANKVRQFWEWFYQNCQNFGADFENAGLIEELDNWIKQLGDYSWELGPGKLKEYALVISPNGDADLLQEIKKIVGEAKDCKNWEYYYSKPPKEWKFIFDLETNRKNVAVIDASNWECTLLGYEDGIFEIIIKAPNLRHLDESDRQTAAEILLDGILGEEARMQSICEIDIVEDFEKPYQDATTSIKNLSHHLGLLTKQKH